MTLFQRYLLASGILGLTHYAAGLNTPNPIIALLILVGSAGLVMAAIPRSQNGLILGTGAMVVAHYASGMNIDNSLVEFFVLLVGCCMIMFGLNPVGEGAPRETGEEGQKRAPNSPPIAFPELYDFAERIQSSSRRGTRIKDEDAKGFLEMLRGVNAMSDASLPRKLSILAEQAQTLQDADTDLLIDWADTVERTLYDSDKRYFYRPDGHNWEILGVHLSGEEDWLAEVSTEGVAIKLVNAMNCA